MSAPLPAEAVCLHTRNWHNSSLVISLFTRELGLISALAKGARRPRSRLGAATSLFAHSRTLLVPPRSGELYLVTEAELLNPFSQLAADYQLLLAASLIAEFLLRTLPPRHPEERIFTLLLIYLEQLSQPAVADSGTVRLLVLSFLLKALAFLGYRPELNRCSQCSQELQPPCRFDPETGSLVCVRCAPVSGPAGLLLDARHLERLRTLLHTPAAEIARLPAEGPEEPLSRFVTLLIRHHYPSRNFSLLLRLTRK